MLIPQGKQPSSHACRLGYGHYENSTWESICWHGSLRRPIPGACVCNTPRQKDSTVHKMRHGERGTHDFVALQLQCSGWLTKSTLGRLIEWPRLVYVNEDWAIIGEVGTPRRRGIYKWRESLGWFMVELILGRLRLDVLLLDVRTYFDQPLYFQSRITHIQTNNNRILPTI